MLAASTDGFLLFWQLAAS